jgi:hypothetical protein
MTDDFVTQAEYDQFCKGVNGSLERIEKTVNELRSGTVNKSIATIIALLTAVAGSGWGVLVTFILTRHH